MTVEHWSMQHPVLGRLDVFLGDAASLHTLDPDFPDGEDVAASKKEKKKLADKVFGYLATKVLVQRDGTTLARCDALQEHKVSLEDNAKLKPGKYHSNYTTSKPMLQIQTNLTNSWVTNIRVKDDRGWVNFDPPAGSKAEKRLEEMEASPFKRWLYPLIGGVGKGGWALVALVLLPMLGRLLPDWHLPDIPWPEINWPSINWPEINLPDINLPEFHLPGWLDPVLPVLDFLAEYSKVWVPVVVGIVVGILAVRNNRKSKDRKAEWEAEWEAELEAEPEDDPEGSNDKEQ